MSSLFFEVSHLSLQ